MTVHVVTDAAKNLEASHRDASRNGAPIRTVNAPLPAIQSLDQRRGAERRQAIPGFAGDDNESFDVADIIKQVEDAASLRPWPAFSDTSPRDGEENPKDPWRELSARRVQITNLQRAQQKQVAALQQARNLIESLDKSVTLFRDGLKLREREAAAAKQALRQAEQEQRELRAELDRTNASYADLLQKTADINAEFEKREKDVAAMRECVATLKAKLTAGGADEDDLTRAIEEAKERYYSDFDNRYARFKAQVEMLANMIGARDERIRNLEEETARYAARCEALATKLQALMSEKHQAQEQLKSHAAVVKFLDTTLRTERETASQKIAELVTELQRERQQRAADASESAMVCKAIVQLLPRLARHPGQAHEKTALAAPSGQPPAGSSA